jgi:hypothetical protein
MAGGAFTQRDGGARDASFIHLLRENDIARHASKAVF